MARSVVLKIQALLRYALVSLGIAASAAVAGCARQSPVAAGSNESTSGREMRSVSDAPGGDGGCIATHDGYLRVRVRGVRNLDIDWRDRDLQCAGGLRPDQAGLRLTFAGPPRRNGHRLRFVFGIAAVQGTGRSRAVPANVTVIF